LLSPTAPEAGKDKEAVAGTARRQWLLTSAGGGCCCRLALLLLAKRFITLYR
jgi:hypothetical protein